MTKTPINNLNHALNGMVDLAQSIQTKATQLKHLLDVCEETHHELDSFTAAGRIEAQDRIGVFLNLAHSMATEIATLGEQIEISNSKLQYPTAA